MTEALNIDEGTLKLKKLVLQRRAAQPGCTLGGCV